MSLTIQPLEHDLSICRVTDYKHTKIDSEFCFIGKTDEENSLVCLTEEVPENTTEREDGWKAFRIVGILDFSLIGILSKITALLAENKIGVFVVSTYNTDYVLVKKEQFSEAIRKLKDAGYNIVNSNASKGGEV